MELLLASIFFIGYLLITLESRININKAATALVTGVACWTVYMLLEKESTIINAELSHHLSSIAEILLFLLGAMTIVELIDAHEGFQLITDRITTTNKTKLLYIICITAFFLSAVLDNLTTTIVMVSLCRKIIADNKDRMLIAGMIIIAANAGGAWSPIGDVTTTMLWVKGQVSASQVILQLFIPSMVCLLLPMFILGTRFKGSFVRPETENNTNGTSTTKKERQIVLFSGFFLLLLVPVFKSTTHLPPYMGMLGALGILWIVTELLHKQKNDEDKNFLTVTYAIRKIDTPSILFFFGILATIACLESTGMLQHLSFWLDEKVKNTELIAISTGLLSALIDNVPLVAATQGMYDLSVMPMDSYMWEFIAYSAGTGGSILIIGSAAGVAAMGLEKIDFVWYLKNIGWLAFIGFLAGAGVYILEHRLFFAN
ncbi:MAG TPA: sodium:proton antiporter NhaD [Flavobacteriales bacterium]|nr:sodium:proton antiporter NhaD [Flavobacteriales bacterium]